ncbi:lipid storage droplets surface-binding protein 2-like [Phymastichus coffea]|uniref:lipid storage droplets surface-binding protein 2-like n=1 Tax=Phymastichus coffea TaxID=108790 RepID=UPI00273B4367|nr:lipid storage droplets surface-binding protein 2-like [Phymastichus coffea]XP_058798109.1 lipid storage droplets surface-binding protein 2-like [Phymastichus coffea]XP_058798110.1 lipid storage droplets surface-binding protein 2-like [Phymastichus coffea]
MTTVSIQLPQMEVFHRILELPVIELAYNKSTSTYTRFKDSNQLVHWALSTAESSLSSASSKAAPYAKKLETPIHFVDNTLCRGLEKFEEKIPIVKEKPEMILEKSYIFTMEKLETALTTISLAHDFLITRATNIKDISWNKINQILSTHYGTAAVTSLDNTVCLVEMLIDKYFPAIGEENFPELVPMERDKLLFTLQTVGRLSNKATKRIFTNVVHHLRILQKDHLSQYLNNLVEFLQMANFINANYNCKPSSEMSSSVSSTTVHHHKQ